jgi:TetR/AcrR family transcriptional repressor of mexCD-oprJ operon
MMSHPESKAGAPELHLQSEDHRILASLALALVNRPRASLQELAKAIGISKATLYRFCHTRDQLIERLVSHSTRVIGEGIQAAQLDTAPPLEALKRFIAHCLEHRELNAFLIHYGNADSTRDLGCEAGWETATDAFFLRGQEEGVFRIDIPAPVLAEIYVGTLLSLVDAERRGRVARAGLASLIERAFLHGAAASA